MHFYKKRFLSIFELLAKILSRIFVIFRSIVSHREKEFVGSICSAQIRFSLALDVGSKNKNLLIIMHYCTMTNQFLKTKKMTYN